MGSLNLSQQWVNQLVAMCLWVSLSPDTTSIWERWRRWTPKLPQILTTPLSILKEACKQTTTLLIRATTTPLLSVASCQASHTTTLAIHKAATEVEMCRPSGPMTLSRPTVPTAKMKYTPMWYHIQDLTLGAPAWCAAWWGASCSVACLFALIPWTSLVTTATDATSYLQSMIERWISSDGRAGNEAPSI